MGKREGYLFPSGGLLQLSRSLSGAFLHTAVAASPRNRKPGREVLGGMRG